MEYVFIIGLGVLIILFAMSKAKSDVKREVSEEVLERAKRAKKNRSLAKRKSIINKLRIVSKKRNS